MKTTLPPPDTLVKQVKLRALRDGKKLKGAQWRICFRWSEGEAREVEIVDYH